MTNGEEGRRVGQGEPGIVIDPQADAFNQE